MFRQTFIFLALICLSCGPSIEDNIDKLGRGGEDREEAQQELLLAKERAIEPLLEALKDLNYTARPELVEVLASLMMRMDDPRIEQALCQHLRTDPDPGVRARIARWMGFQKRNSAIESLVEALSDEDGEVRYQALMALDLFGYNLSDEQEEQVQEKARKLTGDDHEGTRMEASIRVENFVKNWIDEALQLSLKAQLARAESLYAKALTYSPASKQANYRLARFYLDNGQKDKGLRLLRQHGMLLDVPLLPQSPEIDGFLDDAVWQKAARVDSFYQFSNSHYAALPSEVRTKVYIGYRKGFLYMGFHCHDEHPDSLVVNKSPGKVWFDDDVEFYCDPNFDHKTYGQIGFNSAGLVNDEWFLGGLSNRVESWDAEGKSAVYVGDDFWSVEYRLSVGQNEFPQPEPGMLWGFNFIRVYRGSEYSQWVRTYGGNAHQPDDFGLLLFH